MSSIRKIRRSHLFKNYGDLSTVPLEPAFGVELSEPFLIETINADHNVLMSELDIDRPAGPMAWNPCTGPVGVAGVRAGEVIAVHIKELRIVGHAMISVNPQHGAALLLPPEVARARRDFVPISGGIATFPGEIRVPTRPMYGCFGVVPAMPSPEPWHHGGNLDIPDICAGNTVHLRCQREEAWFCCGDGHAVQGDGEMNGVSLEVALEGVLSIERSPYQSLEGILIESPTKFMMVGLGSTLRDSVVHATYALSRFVAQERGVELLEAFQVVSHVANLRVGALWPIWSSHACGTPIPVVLHLSREVVQGAAG